MGNSVINAALPGRAVQSVSAPVRALAETLVGRDGPHARAFDNVILALIVISVLSVVLQATADLPGWAIQVLKITEFVVVAVFTFEYVLRIVAAPHKLEFVFSFYGLVDLVSIAPFYLARLDVRYLRILRLLRLLRVLKLQRRILETTVAERTRELAERNLALVQAQSQLKAELDIARALQIAILPSTFPAKPGCDGAARMIPATSMGGDFYDFIELPDGQVGMVMADVSGKGVPAAFFMAVSRTNLRELAIHHPDPGDCLTRTNEVLCSQNPMDLFVTVFYCIFDPATGVLRYSNGGHNPPFVRRAGGALEVLNEARGLVLGAMPGIDYSNHTVQLRHGDRLVLYTDGVTEAFNPAEEAFGMERLVGEISAHGGGSAADLVERICASVANFAGDAPQSDDITLTVLAWYAA
jgi:serine phosphatase RsbU (regulator of sigma subunit)